MSQTTTAVAASDINRPVQSITPVLTFKDRTEEAINFYVSLFSNSRIVNIVRSEGGIIPAGRVMAATFELDGRPYNAFDGGDSFSFTEGFSLMVTCETQDEIDRLWDRLTEDGGEPGPCGWLTDRFGLSWQIIPADLGAMLSNSAGGNTQKAGEAMMKMSKLDIAALRAAYASES
jgi:predicted 3-demethylubiquinone-9 3-methyltransferase (glyoxalase superfamily)